MKITFGGFFRITPATIMRCGPTFRLPRTHPTHARSSGLETSLRSRSLADYTIDTHESEFSEATGRPSRQNAQKFLLASLSFKSRNQLRAYLSSRKTFTYPTNFSPEIRYHI